MDAVATSNPQAEIVFDMAKRGLLVSPALVAIGAIAWGAHGAFSVLLALAVVLVNFTASAAIVRRSAKLPETFIMMFVLGGFLVRMAVVVAVMALAGHLPWVNKIALGLALVVTHLGLLFWETRHVSLSLAYPGLKPHRGDA